MKRLIILFCVFMIYAVASAQVIVQAEYFVNEDPGFGNGTAIPINPGIDVTLNFDVNTNGLEDGLHTLFIRAKDENGNWCTIVHRPFILGNYPLDPLLPIVRAEYFIDEDPGFGNGTAVPVSPGIDVTLDFDVNTNELEDGLHILFIRAKDENGNWSTIVHRPFMLGNYPSDPLLPIVRAEYFIDEDPGQGQATPVMFDPNNGIHEQEFDANLDGYEFGEHTLYVRSMDESGHWSITVAEPFNVEEPPIVAEFSADITQGSVPLLVQFTDETFISEPTSWLWEFGDGLTSTFQNPQHTYANPGTYSVSLTATNDQGTNTEVKESYITVYPPVYSLEYFFDEDPGYGNAIGVYEYSSSIGGFNFLAPVDELDDGYHTLFVRVKDTSGAWTQTITRAFLKTRLMSDPDPNIVQVEYFVDEDPGYGLGEQLAVNNVARPVIEALISLDEYDDGLHNLYVRSKDANGRWSETMARPFLKSYVPNDVVNVASLEYFIDTDPGVGNGTPVSISNPSAAVERNFVVNLGPHTPGEHRLFVRAVDERGHWSIVYNQAFEVEPSTACIPPNTLTASDITTNSATLGWNPGGTETEWDIQWGVAGFDPETSGNLITDVFINSFALENLSPATAYDFYVRAVCKENDFSYWAGSASFTTQEEQIINVPTVLSAEVEQVTQTTAVSGGNISSNGGAAVTARGVVWSTNQNPSIETHQGISYDGTGIGTWVSALVGLTPGTEYYIRAYATNSAGTAYGEQLSFITLSGEPPNWEPNPYFQYNMQIIGQLEYEDGTISLNANDLLGAFVAEECRGVMSPDPGFMGILFLTVGSNQQLGETVTFKAWLNDENRIVDLNQSLIFENQLQTGSIGSPFIFYYGQTQTQTIAKPAGWSGISSYIIPDDAALANIFAPVQNELVILQNFQGMYWPFAGVNTLGNWNDHAGYQIKMETAQQVTFTGEMQSNLIANLSEGWNYLPVLNACDNDVEDLFAPVFEYLQIVKEVAGWGVYWPQFGVNTLGEILPGKAYFVLVDEDVEVEFAECPRTPSGSLPKSRDRLLRGRTSQRSGIDPWGGTPFPSRGRVGDGVGLCVASPLTHTIAIPLQVISGFAEGSIITICNQFGLCCGAAELQKRNLVLTVFGDDPTTPAIDGMTEGEVMTFRIFNPETGKESSLELIFDEGMPQGGYFANHGLSAIKHLESTGVDEMGELGLNISVYPNPSNGIFNIRLTTLSGFLTLTEFDWELSNIQGSAIATGNDEIDDFTINLSTYPKGIYYLKIFQGGLQTVEKLVVQ